MVEEKTEFDKASYYTCRDAEVLTCETAEEAIVEYFEYDAEPNCRILEDIKAGCPIDVMAYTKQSVTGVRAYLEDSIESMIESLDEEYGDPDGDTGADGDAMAVLVDQLTPIVQQWIKDHYSVWACERVAKKTYSAEEVEAILRESNPEWFEEKTG